MQERKRLESAFTVPFLHVAVTGTVVCAAFYGAILSPVLSYPILTRYALCHWVAIASVWLFCMACVSLLHKYWTTFQQIRATNEGSHTLQFIVEARHELDSSTRGDGFAMSQWLETLWRSQKSYVLRSWLGQRVSEFLSRQVKRRHTQQMDEDLRDLADQDGEAQHASHGIIRIICWAMPMLGFLGTVLGISDTLGHMDAQALASGSQEAMNSLTSGLYVAFDTTAVGLILTMIAMFIQFSVQRMELRLLSRVDAAVASAMQECLSMPEAVQDTSGVQQALREIARGLLDSVQQLVQKQTELWRDTISEAHQQWLHLSNGVVETTKAGFVPALQESLHEFSAAMRSQAEDLVRLQAEGAQQIDSRLQQWQVTISEQSRASLRQQQEINRHAELLAKLLESTQLVGAMQAPVEATLSRLTEIDRFHDAAVCLTEAVAFLGTQMERHGVLGRQTARRRAAEPKVPESESPSVPLQVVAAQESEEAASEAVPMPPADRQPHSWKRRAG